MRLTKFAKHFKNPNKFAPKFRKFGFFAKTSLFFGSAFILSDWIRNPFVEYSKFNNRFKNDEESKKIFFEHSAVPFLGAIIGINVFVHCFWQFSKIYKPLEKIMVKHFTLQSHVFARNPHTLITHMFSHHSVLHLLVNIVCLTSFSNVLLPAIGVSDFAKIYFGFGNFFDKNYVCVSELLNFVKK
ncbi:hypothetical protein MHBO_004001 [Bonamia ostreae]|uniref:Peptidase S54 rhomboid domain-containing protein n=1 Tax=Bonamia ostreae TaxID=126728 RepID=A0ABV2AS44_9EUKA